MLTRGGWGNNLGAHHEIEDDILSDFSVQSWINEKRIFYSVDKTNLTL